MSLVPAMEMLLPQASGGNVPAFLSKLWKMVNNPEIAHLISWSEGGSSFLIKNQPQFSSSLLPYYYKHSNMSSFVRQLNMYNFHKVMNVDAGGLKGEKEEVEFAHPYFLRGQEHLLDQIKRKVSVPTCGPVQTEKVSEVLSEVGLLKGRQEDLNGKLAMMRNENSELWGEVETLRQKHSKQERVVNKLIQFLGTMVQPQGNTLKRKLKPSISMLQLAIEEECSNEKEPRVEFPAEDPPSQEARYENTGDEVSKSQYNMTKEHQIITETTVEKQWNTTDNKDSGSSYPIIPEFQTPTIRPVLQRQITKEDFDVDVSTIETELDSLKNIIAGQITLDMDTVASLFDGSVDNIPNISKYGTEFFQDAARGNHRRINEDIYNPSVQNDDDNSGRKAEYEKSKQDQNIELNTPLVQDIAQDPLKQFLNN